MRTLPNKSSLIASLVTASVLLGHSQAAHEMGAATEFPEATVNPAGMQPSGYTALGGGSGFAAAPVGGNRGISPLMPDGKMGPPLEKHWKLLLGLTLGAVYDDNIFLVPRNKTGDFIFTISPTIGLQFGDQVAGRNFFKITYTPSFVFFADNSDENSIEQDVELSFVRQTDFTKLSGNFQFLDLSGVADSTAFGSTFAGEQQGQRLEQKVYTSGAEYAIKMTDRTSLSLGFSEAYINYNNSPNTLNLLETDYIDYLYSDKTSVGLGFGIGYANTQGEADQVYEQGNLRFKYAPTGKLVVSGTGGVEFRQIRGGQSQVTGVFDLGFTYTPTEKATITFDAYRRVLPSSLVSNSDYVVTGFSLTERQQLVEKLSLVTAVGYEHTDYQSLYSGQGFGRTDNYVFVRPSLRYAFHENITAELFYEYRRNASTINSFEFVNNRGGIQVALTF